MDERFHSIVRVIDLDLTDQLIGGPATAVMAELKEMRGELPYADRLVLRLEWHGPAEEPVR